MGADGDSPPAGRLLRALLLLPALDSLAAGAWAAVHPEGLFAWLQLGPTDDGRLLCRILGLLLLTHVLCLAVAAWRPAAWGGLVIVPLLSRLLLAGLWLWLLYADRVHAAPQALRLLLLDAVVWLPLFGAFLAAPSARRLWR